MNIEQNTIIIVARNNLHLTQKAVASALAQDVPCDVILIDNASTDGTMDWGSTKPLATVSFMGQRSLSYCWNYALTIMFAQGRRHALVLNNDVEVQPCTYRMLVAHGGPFVTCVSVDKREQLSTPPDVRGERPHPDFSAFLIRKECFERVGPFDELYYPAYCEDNDYHVRMHRAGIRAVCIDLPFLHHGAGTIKSASVQERRIIERGADRNRQRFKDKYGCLPGTPEYATLFREAANADGSSGARHPLPIADDAPLPSAPPAPDRV